MHALLDPLTPAPLLFNNNNNNKKTKTKTKAKNNKKKIIRKTDSSRLLSRKTSFLMKLTFLINYVWYVHAHARLSIEKDIFCACKYYNRNRKIIAFIIFNKMSFSYFLCIQGWIWLFVYTLSECQQYAFCGQYPTIIC